MRKRLIVRIFVPAAFALAGLVYCTWPVAAENRVALVVGKSDYKNITPLDNPSKDASLIAETLATLRQMQGSGTRLNIVILDACRNNPFGSRGLRSSEGAWHRCARWTAH
jgi:hypothetical protein